MALQLRYLQTLTEIGVEKNTTVIFPIPIDILEAFRKRCKPITVPATVPRQSSCGSEP